ARDSVNLALDGVPRGIELAKVSDYLAGLEGVTEVHDLHIWAMSTNETALTRIWCGPAAATTPSCTASARSCRTASTSTTPRCRSKPRPKSAGWRRRTGCSAGA